ncbi:MAG: endonuclease III [Candidatus Parvarchaeota archaeon]|nr:endonuclease III [Candidatus Jingweiarchaeum tengchongense]MCW1298381.1 endonuclease III [Candidatus Jingweiarchaeum tengchongense]MCW1300317.1 endonuclease III [Candidatus Jingweiarchaeum tengchongense]MCW1304886.1 endonuclease III [Candidatus Jingweiarchaeum tengchongense]MCW1305813.1 endonuclease III [Candidatus Jingweiarchaeum tengchongense]
MKNPSNNFLDDVIHILKRRYHVVKYKDEPLHVLFTTLLSQRTRDEITHEASKKLFKKFKKIDDFINADVKEIEETIRPVGFYRIKAKRIKEIAKILKERYNGKVPREREVLINLPGVGKKTADCVLCFGYGVATIPVDVHVAVVAKRLGIVDEKDGYEKIKEKIEALVKEKDKKLVNFLFVEFGKEICRTSKPKCEMCPIKRFCRYVN